MSGMECCTRGNRERETRSIRKWIYQIARMITTASLSDYKMKLPKLPRLVAEYLVFTFISCASTRTIYLNHQHCFPSTFVYTSYRVRLTHSLPLSNVKERFHYQNMTKKAIWKAKNEYFFRCSVREHTHTHKLIRRRKKSNAKSHTHWARAWKSLMCPSNTTATTTKTK